MRMIYQEHQPSLYCRGNDSGGTWQPSGEFLDRELESDYNSNSSPTSRFQKATKVMQKMEDYPLQQIEDEEALQSEQLTPQTVGETTLLISKNKKPDNPIPSASLVLKRIAGGVQKCAGYRGDITSSVKGWSLVRPLEAWIPNYICIFS